MAVDKLVDSTQLDSDLTSVANAIRTKGGTSAQLAFPADFVSAINAISGGGATSPISFNNIRISWVEVTAGSNSVTKFNAVNPYFLELANVPSTRIGYMFAIKEGQTLTPTNIVVCSGDATSYAGYRYRSGAYNKVNNINSASTYDAVIPAGTKYYVMWIQLSGV